MTREFSKQQSKFIAEKAAIIANTAFGLGRTAERNRIIEVLTDELSEEQLAHIKTLIESETNDRPN